MMSRNREQVLIHAIIFFLQNTKTCFKTKLLKLLYHFDFEHYRQTGFSATGLDYEAWENGPVARDLWNAISPRETVFANPISANFDITPAITYAIALQPRIPFDRDVFTPRQLDILEKVASTYRDALADDMRESTHLLNQPWHNTIRRYGLNARIDYDLALTGSGQELSREEIAERQAEAREVEEFFNPSTAVG